MKKLTYEYLKKSGYGGYLLENGVERVLQFGEGNFLRAFADYFIDVSNERLGLDTKVVLVQPMRGGKTALFATQDCLYTHYQRGISDGAPVDEKRIISCVSRCISASEDPQALLDCAKNPELRIIISNTTEAGIIFRPEDTLEGFASSSFPGKLTRFLYERFRHFGGAVDKGFILLPCELIDDNGGALLGCVLKYAGYWRLGGAFTAWLERANTFCSTLVDRIVPGYPAGAEALDAQNGYADELAVCSEPFAFWAIEGGGPLEVELPFARACLPVTITPDCAAYKLRKVRILNGAHTSFVCAAVLCGLATVEEAMRDDALSEFYERAVYGEIIPALELPRAMLIEYAAAVRERFMNPYIRHELMSITLNMTSKWRARVLPGILAYARTNGRLPALLTFSFAAYLAFMAGGAYAVSDDEEVLAFFAAHAPDDAAQLTSAVCAREDFWGMKLGEIAGFCDAACSYLGEINARGMRGALERLLHGGLL